MRRHPEEHKIAARLKKEGITAFYHFTSVENLSGICRHQALCSKAFLESRKEWPVPQPGGNQLSHELDQRKGNWNFVSLTFTPHTPMAYRRKSELHLCFLEILTDVALRKGVVFTDSNAAHSAQRRGEGLSGLDLVNFGLVRSDPLPWNADWVHQSQAEVLVPDCIGVESIRKVYFVSNASLREGIRMWGKGPRSDFAVDKVHFADYPNSPDDINFPYVIDVFLLDSEITEKNAWHNHQSKERFRKRSGVAITVLIEAKALTGTQGRLRWDPPGADEQTEFAKSSVFRWWSRIPMSSLPVGHCSIEIWLDDIRWLIADFKMVA